MPATLAIIARRYSSSSSEPVLRMNRVITRTSCPRSASDETTVSKWRKKPPWLRAIRILMAWRRSARHRDQAVVQFAGAGVGGGGAPGGGHGAGVQAVERGPAQDGRELEPQAGGNRAHDRLGVRHQRVRGDDREPVAV